MDLRSKRLSILKMLSLLSAMFVFAIALPSCTEEGNEALVAPFDTPSNTSTEEVPIGKEKGGESFQALSNFNSGWYLTAVNYQNNYKHVKQGTNECSWTNYVLAAAAIIRAKGNTAYPYGAGGYTQKIAHCKQWCNNSSLVTTINSYCQNVDKAAGYPINSVVRSYSSINAAIEGMLDHLLYNAKPLIYIGASGSIGHYYIVWEINWTGNPSTSTVYYTNTLSSEKSTFTAQLESANLQSFVANKGSNTYYNLLCLY